MAAANRVTKRGTGSHGSFPGVMTLQILVVEDHGDTRRVLAGLLGHFGHSISAADNVESAFAFLSAKHFDAVVSDLALPDGSGCEVIREAKRRQRLTGVALTADGEDDDIRRGRDAGFDYHLTKPIDFAQLREVLEQISPTNAGGRTDSPPYFTSSVTT
jgi:CheY-like chemotaxis protein